MDNAGNNFILYFSQWMLLVAIIGSLGLLIALMVYRQETPTNYILLALFVSTCTFLFGKIFCKIFIGIKINLPVITFIPSTPSNISTII